jgi:hypothetical protein
MQNTTIGAYGPDLADLRTIITRYTARSAAGGFVVVFYMWAGPFRGGGRPVAGRAVRSLAKAAKVRVALG